MEIVKEVATIETGAPKPVYTLIKSKAEYDEFLQELKDLLALDPQRDTPDGDRLELLLLLIKEYDSRHFKFDAPDPIDAILFRMDQQGLKRKDLIPYLGSRHKVSEVLNRKRPLSLKMMRALHEGLGIPLEVLVQEPRTPSIAAIEPSVQNGAQLEGA